MEVSPAPQRERARRASAPQWLISGAIALLVLGLLAYALVSQPTAPPEPGSLVPHFALAALDSTIMDLGAQREHVVVINFFASWCAPCLEEAADLEETWRQYQSQGVQFYGIAYKDAASRAQAFLDDFEVTFPAAVDPTNRTARAYGVTGVPETFIVDGQGRLVYHSLGPITQAQLSQQIEKALGR